MSKYLAHFCLTILLDVKWFWRTFQFNLNLNLNMTEDSDCHPENAAEVHPQLQPTCQTLSLRLAAPICLFFFFSGQLASWLSVLHPGGNPGLPRLLPSDVHHHVSCSASTLCADALTPGGFGSRHCLPARHSVSFWMFSGSWRLCPSSLSLLLRRDSTQCVHWLLFVFCVCVCVGQWCLIFVWRALGFVETPYVCIPAVKILEQRTVDGLWGATGIRVRWIKEAQKLTVQSVVGWGMQRWTLGLIWTKNSKQQQPQNYILSKSNICWKTYVYNFLMCIVLNFIRFYQIETEKKSPFTSRQVFIFRSYDDTWSTF